MLYYYIHLYSVTPMFNCVEYTYTVRVIICVWMSCWLRQCVKGASDKCGAEKLEIGRASCREGV